MTMSRGGAEIGKIEIVKIEKRRGNVKIEKRPESVKRMIEKEKTKRKTGKENEKESRTGGMNVIEISEIKNTDEQKKDEQKRKRNDFRNNTKPSFKRP